MNAPFVCGDFDSRMESLESARLLLLHTDKPGWVATTCGQEVKYLVELAQLAAVGGNFGHAAVSPAQRIGLEGIRVPSRVHPHVPMGRIIFSGTDTPGDVDVIVLIQRQVAVQMVNAEETCPHQR